MTDPNDPAHPHKYMSHDSTGEYVAQDQWAGLTKREYFAATSEVSWNAVMELCQLEGIQKPTLEQKITVRARIKKMEADALIVELNK